MQISERWNIDRMEKLEVEDIYEPYSNVLLAADYIAELRDNTDYGDDVSYVLMRYNMRTDTANKLYKQGKTTSYATKVLELSQELEEEHGK